MCLDQLWYCGNSRIVYHFSFFFNDTATTEIYTVLTHSFPTRRSSDLGAFTWTGPYGGGKSSAALLVANLIAGSDENRKIAKARSEEHTSELQSLMRISYAVFCLKKKKTKHKRQLTNNTLHTTTQGRTTYKILIMQIRKYHIQT